MTDETNTNTAQETTPTQATVNPMAAPAKPAAPATTPASVAAPVAAPAVTAVKQVEEKAKEAVTAAVEKVAEKASAPVAEAKAEVKAEVKEETNKVVTAVTDEVAEVSGDVEVDQDKIHSAIRDFLGKKNYLFETEIEKAKEWTLVHHNAFVAYCRNKLSIVHPRIPTTLEQVYEGIKRDADWLFGEATKVATPATTAVPAPAQATSETLVAPTTTAPQTGVPTSTFSVNTK